MGKDHAQIKLPFSLEKKESGPFSTQGNDEFNRQPSEEWRESGFDDVPAPGEEPKPPRRSNVSPSMLRSAAAAQWQHPRDAWDNKSDD